MAATPLLPLPPTETRRALRDAMGLTLKEAAGEVGVSARTYLRWEWGDVNPNPDNHRKYQQQLQQWQDTVEESLRNGFGDRDLQFTWPGGSMRR
jgi:DNA-binding XRE family transcriptional regulator